MSLFPKLRRRCCALISAGCRWSTGLTIATSWDIWGGRGFWRLVYGDCMTSMCGSRGGLRASRGGRPTRTRTETAKKSVEVRSTGLRRGLSPLKLSCVIISQAVPARAALEAVSPEAPLVIDKQGCKRFTLCDKLPQIPSSFVGKRVSHDHT